MSYNDYRKCSKCGANRIGNPSLSLHRFPQLAKDKYNLNQLRAWAVFSFPDKDWSKNEDLEKLHRANKVLCGQHFSDSAYTAMDRKRLIKHAVPMDETNENLEVPQLSCITQSKSVVMNTQDNNNLAIAGPSSRTQSRPILMDISENQENIQSCNKQSASTLMDKTKTSILKPKTNLVTKTPREQKLYNRCKYLLKVVRKLRQSLKGQKKLDTMKAIHDNEAVAELFNYKIGSSLALLLQGELQNGQRKLKGRRWSKDQKFLALELYKKSPSCYRLLSRLFCLPSISTVRNILGQVQLKTGINDKIFESLKNMVKHQPSEHNVCSLIFDEMSIRKNLQYNNKEDYIEGYQDHSNQGRSQQVASHALVFMLVGLRKKWKQPIAYYLSGDSVTADRLSIIIKEVLTKCLDSGLNVVATVCDNAGVNIKALEILGSSVQKPYFILKGQEIVTLPDPPHLLKCFRNLFLKYNVVCATDIQSAATAGVGIAKWKHIEDFYKLDNENPNFVFAPALTKHHLNPNGKEKMRVKLAAQVFSHSVAAGIYAKIATNELPAEAAATANFLDKLDKLFDLVNADSKDRKRGKPYSTNLTQKSPHKEYFKIMKIMITNMKFVGSRGTPPSQTGWIKLINGYERLWDNLKKADIKSLATRRLNQDPVENLFGCIRHNCGSNNNPTVAQFTAGLKTSIISNLRNTNKNKNCEEDNAVLIENFKSFFTNKKSEYDDKEHNVSEQCDELIKYNVPEDIVDTAETQACAYVCGYIYKRMKNDCEACKRAMLTDAKQQQHIFIEFKEYNISKHSLHYANVNFIACVENCADYLNKFLRDKSTIVNLKKKYHKEYDRDYQFYVFKHLLGPS